MRSCPAVSWYGYVSLNGSSVFTSWRVKMFWMKWCDTVPGVWISIWLCRLLGHCEDTEVSCVYLVADGYTLNGVMWSQVYEYPSGYVGWWYRGQALYLLDKVGWRWWCFELFVKVLDRVVTLMSTCVIGKQNSNLLAIFRAWIPQSDD